MVTVDKGIETQIANIQTMTGKSLDDFRMLIKASGLTKHSDIREMLQRETGLTHVRADTLILYLRKQDEARVAEETGTTVNDVIDQIYTGPKAALRPIHDLLMAQINEFGPFEIAPKKGYISLRRKKQFAMIGPATNTRVEVGLNVKNQTATERLVELPAGNLCNYKVKLTQAEEVDPEVIAWIKAAYDSAG
jgi:hypothetical protein